MAENTVSMTLAQLVDLSLCSTEMGTVNFSILHALLQVLIQQVNRSDVTVEFTGKDSDRIQNLLKAVNKPIPCVTLTEYKIVGNQRIKQRVDETQIVADDEDKSTDKSVVVVESNESTIPQFSVAINKEQFDQMQNDIVTLQQQLKELKELPGNLDLIEATRDKNSPILDMFQIITVSKRVDAVEASLEKVASLIEDLINQTTSKRRNVLDTVEDVRTSIDDLVRNELEEIVTRSADIAEHVDSSTAIEATIREEFDKIVTKIEETYETPVLQERSSVINNKINELYQRIEELTKQINEIMDSLKSKDVCESMMENLVSRLDGDNEKIGKLYDNLMEIQNQLQALKEFTNKLEEESNNCQKNIDAILEQIDFLKITKANHEDLQDLLESKADACVVNRKVSNDIFEETCDGFSKAIEDALNKLTQQEQLWLETLDNIQREIGNKLDRGDVDSLKDFINDKLKDIQDKFKMLKSLKSDQEAAGTKRKLLKDLNCISCDQDVVMRKEMDPSLKPKPYALPPTRNIAPYLAYELDQLRTQQKRLPSGKNLNHFESAIKTSKETKNRDHLCSRYCGGSHTITTAEQRVTRVGHFLKQWGLKVTPMCEDKYVRGKDNHFYKADPQAEKPIKRSSTAVIGRKKSSKPSMLLQNGIVTPRNSMEKSQSDNTEGVINEETGLEESIEEMMISSEVEQFLSNNIDEDEMEN